MRPAPSPKPVLILLCLAATVTAAVHARPARAEAAADSIRYATRIANGNLMGVTLTNYGFLGNNFVSRGPSFEYPDGSGYDHLPRGGLWVGAEAVDDSGAFVGVSTGCFDGYAGYSPISGTGATEFTPAGLTLTETSSLYSSQYYDPTAISEQDVDCWFSDEPAMTLSPENHRPLNILVHQASYAWSFADLAHVLYLRYVVHNQGQTLRNAYVGLYTELASGSKNDFSCWPPSSHCTATYGAWYSKRWVQYDDSLRLLREHFCQAAPVPASCNLSRVPCWAGVRLLGVRPGSLADTSMHVTLAAWNWSADDPARDQDVERYAIMSADTIQDLAVLDGPPNDPVELFCVGPFAEIAPGDSVTVDFALVGGAEIADIQQHARTAQQLYDGGFDITVPVEVSLVSAGAEPGVAHLRWSVARGADLRWTVARSQDGLAWAPVGAAVVDGAGYATFEDRNVTGGERYGYRLQSPDGDAFGEVWVEVPRGSTFALLGARPNPAGPEGLRVSFSLAEAGPVTLEVFDTGGRRVLARDLGTLAPGNHLVSMGRAARLRPGACFIRLRQGDRVRTRRAVVLE